MNICKLLWFRCLCSRSGRRLRRKKLQSLSLRAVSEWLLYIGWFFKILKMYVFDWIHTRLMVVESPCEKQGKTVFCCYKHNSRVELRVVQHFGAVLKPHPFRVKHCKQGGTLSESVSTLVKFTCRWTFRDISQRPSFLRLWRDHWYKGFQHPKLCHWYANINLIGCILFTTC